MHYKYKFGRITKAAYTAAFSFRVNLAVQNSNHFLNDLRMFNFNT